MAQLNESDGSVGQLVAATEKRHEALALLLTDIRGEPGLATALQPAPMKAFDAALPDRCDARQFGTTRTG